MKNHLPKLVGIDFGARMAGTTAIAYLQNEHLVVSQCQAKSDADQWLNEKIVASDWNMIFLDAPISLPAGCLGQGNDFSFRLADRLTQAMSPMFLGGLTARAMSHACNWRNMEKQVFEAYPGKLVREYPELKMLYNKKKNSTITEFEKLLRLTLPFEVEVEIQNYHQADSLLCWFTGYRLLNGEAVPYGDEKEGIIWI